MGKSFDLASLAKEAPFRPPAFSDGNGRQHETVAVGPAVRTVPISSVATNPLNKRPPGEDDELEEMAETIREHGLIQPLVVCSAGAYRAEFPDQSMEGVDWVALIGNRRLVGARKAGLTEVDIVVNDDRVTSMYEVMLVENGQRRDLPPALEAEAMEQVLGSAGISQRELARRIGKSAMYITQRLALLKLVPELRAALEQGELTVKLARLIGELPESAQEAVVAAGRPYRLPREDDSTARPVHAAVRRISVSTPAATAESIRKLLGAEELAELIRLLSELSARAGQEE
jgi:ParB family transcriptional regulator, chromosome partitioning protein